MSKVDLYDVTGRKFVAEEEDVDRRVAEGYLTEAPEDSDRTAPIETAHSVTLPGAVADDAGVTPPTGDGYGWPAGNASTEAWRDAAIAHDVPAEQLEGLGRDEIRDRFGPQD